MVTTQPPETAHGTAPETPTLPRLESGVTLLTAEAGLTSAMHSLVLDHVLYSNGEAVWVDARNRAATTSLAKLAPSRRTLERIQVARAFTAFQHYSLVETLPQEVSEETALVVAPSVEHFYANDDLCAGEDETMLAGALEALVALAAAEDLPVLLTRQSETGLGRRVADYSDRTLSCTRTRFGPRFAGEDFETLVYESGGAIQTTLSFWRRVLARRHADRLAEPTTVPEVVARGTH